MEVENVKEGEFIPEWATVFSYLAMRYRKNWWKPCAELVGKAAGAAVLISLGNYALLKLGSPIGPVIFAFGLMGVCVMGQNLFTGKCGFLFADKINWLDLLVILIVNLGVGYLMGMMYATMDAEVVAAAVGKVSGWEVSLPFFLKAVMCGVIMYIAVFTYRKGTMLGILFGVPLFIFCGFQHCIANVITMGAAMGFDWSLVLAVVGNFVGSLAMWAISRDVA